LKKVSGNKIVALAVWKGRDDKLLKKKNGSVGVMSALATANPTEEKSSVDLWLVLCSLHL